MLDYVIDLCFVVRYVVSILALQSSYWGERAAVCFALFAFLVSRDCCVWLFLAMPRVCLQFLIVIFPIHTHLISLLVVSQPVRMCNAGSTVHNCGSVQRDISCRFTHTYFERTFVFKSVVKDCLFKNMFDFDTTGDKDCKAVIKLIPPFNIV